MAEKQGKESRNTKTGEQELAYLLKGGYTESVWKEVLSEEEMEMFLGINENERLNALEELGILTIRERRMLKRIQDLLEHDFTVTEIEQETGITEKGPVNKKKVKKQAVLGQVQAIEEALTRVQTAKLNVIKTLHEIQVNLGGSVDVNVYVNALNAQAEEVWGDGKEQSPKAEK